MRFPVTSRGRPPRAGYGAARTARSMGLCLAWGLAGLVALVQPARADDLADFEHARDAYEEQHFDQAITRFEDLVGGSSPRVRSQALRLESRKYLGASYLFVGREAEAREQFRLLLEEDSEYTLDPLSFPAAVLSAFERAREELVEAQRAAEQEAAERARVEALEAERRQAAEAERIRRLEELAAWEVVVVRNSRLLATMPFGVGQFRNGQRALGVGLAVGQTLLLGGAFGTSVALWSLNRQARRCVIETDCVRRGEPDPSPRSPAEVRFQDRSRRLRVSNLVISGAFASLFLAGAIHAHITFVPERRTRRRRSADDLQTTTLDVGIGLGTAELRVNF